MPTYDEDQFGGIEYTNYAIERIGETLTRVEQMEKKTLVAFVSIYIHRLDDILSQEDMDNVCRTLDRMNMSQLRVYHALLSIQGTSRVFPKGKMRHVCNQCGNIVREPVVLHFSSSKLKRLLKVRELANVGYLHWTQLPHEVDGCTQSNAFFTEMAYWGLMTQKKGGNGLWRITQRGHDFLDGKVRIPVELRIHNKSIIEVSDILVSCTEVSRITPYRLKEVKRRHMARKKTPPLGVDYGKELASAE